MSKWTTISKTMVLQRMTVDERDTVGTVDNPKDEAGASVDVLQMTIDSTIAEIRNAIETCEKNVLDYERTDTIPQSLVPTALALINYRYGIRALSQPMLEQDARFQEYNRALQTLDKLRTCEILAENPETGVLENSASAIAVASARCVRFTRKNFRRM